MPHISLKMIKGRTQEQKKKLAESLSKVVQEVLNIGEAHISVAVEDYTGEEWQKVFEEEIVKKEKALYKKPGYDPKSLL
jgi:4-oxalocrotonate tautomerase